MNPRIIFICLFSIFSILATAQDKQAINQTAKDGKKQGHWIKKYPNGNVMYDGFFKNGNPAGEFKRYYEDKTLKSVLVFNTDGAEATAVLYYPNGFVASRGKYVNQLKEGKWQFFSPTSKDKIVCEEEYLHNKRSGLSVVFYADSTIAEKINYKNDLKNGEWLKYYQNGALILKTFYVNGKLNGKFEAFFDNGKPEFIGQYKNDLKDGLWIIYKKDGSQRFRTEYISGVANNRDIDIYESDYIDSLERNKVKIADPEKTGEIW
jgi:antitoxin component YwqK of YwqJK toxin-antitoxin module